MDNNLYLNDNNYICSNTMNCPNRPCIYFPPCNLPDPSIYKPSMEYQVVVPINLAKSLEGNILWVMQMNYHLEWVQCLG